MDYYLFLDECGDHGLTRIDPEFPIFVLCGVLISLPDYETLKAKVTNLKAKFWNNKKVILHSREIIEETPYEVIASAIDKEKYLKKYGLLTNNVYQVSLSFIVERSIFCLDSKTSNSKKLTIGIEKRGKKEDNELKAHFQKLLQVGTYYVSSDRIESYQTSIHFKDKKEDIVGLQISDLVAYPIARYILDPKRANPAFDLVKTKFYKRGKVVYGLKVFP